MKYKILIVSILALLSFFSVESSSFNEPNIIVTEVDFEHQEEIEDDEKMHSVKIVNHAQESYCSAYNAGKNQSKLLYYGIFKPPKLTFS